MTQVYIALPSMFVEPRMIQKFIKPRNKANESYSQRLLVLYLAAILLLGSYTPEPNPGPMIPKNSAKTMGQLTDVVDESEQSGPTRLQHSWFCGTCDVTVKWGDRGVACETCGQWFHAHCQSIDTQLYHHLGNSEEDIPWNCAICGNPNSQTVFDLHGVEWPDSTANSNSKSDLLDSSGTEQPCLSPSGLNLTRPLHASTPSRASQRNKCTKRPLRVLNINFQSLPGKKAEVINLIDSIKPDILIGTETWLDSEIKDAEILPDIYTVYRKDRNRSGGGVLIAVRTDLDSYIVPELSAECELLWVRLKLQGRRSLYVCAYYRPDKSDEVSLEHFGTSLSKAAVIHNALILVGGDLNFPGLDWKNMELKPGCPYPSLHRRLLDLLSDCGMEQLVEVPTREVNTLDLIITDRPELIPRIETLPGLSDHDGVYCEVQIHGQRKKQIPRLIPLYKKANWEGLKGEMTYLADEVEKDKATYTTEQLWTKFKTTLRDATQKFIPHKTARLRESKPWITADLRKLIKKRDRVFRKMRKQGTEELKEEVKKLRRQVQRQLRRAYWEHLNKIFTTPSDSTTDQNAEPKYKRFWSFIKHQKSSSTGVAPLKFEGRLTSEPSAQAEILNKQFQSVFSKGTEYSEEEFTQKCNMKPANFPELNDIKISEEGVKKLLQQLKPDKASGPDNISPRILKELASEVAPTLTTIFQSSLSTGTVPSDWKDANVTPVFKKGEQYDPANYRPVSLTSIPCKIMEHIITSAIMNHLEKNKILREEQHGFRKRKSCETQLLEFIDELLECTEQGKQTSVLIMDFAKAFDKVNHSLLLHKLDHYGVRGQTRKWIADFLRNRRQAVVVNGTSSSYTEVRSGVPQGSVLGPCLFLVYINDLPEKITAKTRLFADDTAIYKVIAAPQDHAQLQQDLDTLAEWEKSWDMAFHPDKCNTLIVTKSRNPKELEYSLHGQTLQTVDSTKYLGVTIKKDLSWKKHIENISSKANKTLGFLRRNLKISSQTIRELAYKAFVRPILEYSSSVWDPHQQQDIDLLEAVQRRAARFVLRRYRNTSSVSAMLQELGWPSLHQRRQTARLTMLYKIKHDLVSMDSLKTKLAPPPPRQRRTHSDQLGQIFCRTKYRQAGFLPRTIRDWNALPQRAVEANSVDTFVSMVSSL